MPALYKDGKNYSHNGSQVDVDITKGSPNAAPSGKVYDKFEEVNTRLTQVEDKIVPSERGNVYNFPTTDGATYVAPTDGYLFVYDGGTITILDTYGRISSESNHENLVFIRKGMVLTRKGSSGLCRFIGLA